MILAGLPTGTYRVGFFDWSGVYLTEYYDDAPDVDSATDVAVAAEATTTGIDAVLSEGGHIAGTVTNSSGASLWNISVVAYQNQNGYWSSIGSTTTDGSGRYDIDGLATNTYRLRFYDGSGTYLTEYYDDASDVDSATDVAVTAAATTSGIDASLAEGGHIAGAVTNASGVALAGIAVEVSQNQGGWWSRFGSTTTDGSGRYDIGGLATGTYRVTFQDWSGAYLTEYYDDAPNIDSATDIAVVAEATTAGIDAILAEGGHISGTVTNSGGGVLGRHLC